MVSTAPAPSAARPTPVMSHPAVPVLYSSEQLVLSSLAGPRHTAPSPSSATRGIPTPKPTSPTPPATRAGHSGQGRVTSPVFWSGSSTFTILGFGLTTGLRLGLGFRLATGLALALGLGLALGLALGLGLGAARIPGESVGGSSVRVPNSVATLAMVPTASETVQISQCPLPLPIRVLP